MKSGNDADCGGAVDAHAEKVGMGISIKMESTETKTEAEGTSTLLSRALKYTLPLLLLFAVFTTSPLYTRLLSTAIPPPGPLPPPNTKSDFTLQKLFAPILLLFVALLIPARTQLQRWLVSAVFIPAILYIHWENLACGSRSSVLGFNIGAYCAYHTYQTLDLLLFSCPRTTFFRVPIHIQQMHILTGAPIPPCFLEGYPTALPRRIHWVFELVMTMRYIGWHTPDSQPTSPAHLLLSIDPTLHRSRFVMMLLVHIVAMGILVNVLVWNIQRNDTTFYIPQLLLTGGEVVYTHNVPAVAIYPDPPQMTFSLHFPWLMSLPQNALYTPLSTPPPPKYFPPPPPSSSSSSSWRMYAMVIHLLTPPLRALAQTLCAYAAVTGVWALITLATMLLGYLVYPPYSSTTTAERISASRWFNPAAYPHPFTFSSTFAFAWSDEIGVGVGVFWARCWHGVFRRGFMRPWAVLGGWIDEYVSGGGGNGEGGESEEGGINRRKSKSWTHKILLLTGTFALSGILHLCGTRTSTTTGRGGWGCVVFFAVQPLAILAEAAVRHIWAAAMVVVGGGEKKGRCTRGFELAVAYLWTIAWLVYTSQWYFGELAWAAAWRVEAAPVSLWRGVLGEGWFRWGMYRDDWGGEWGWWEWSLGGRGWGVVV